MPPEPTDSADGVGATPEAEDKATSPTARSRDTRDKVHEVAYALLRDGTVPNVRNVRARIGKGSMTTITEELKVFWETLGQRLDYPTLPETVAGAAMQLWHAACAAADEGLAERRAAMEDTVAAAQDAKDLAEQESRSLAAQLEREQERVTALTEALDTERSRAGQLAERLAREESTRQHTEVRLAEARSACDRLTDEKTADLKALRAAHEQALTQLRTDQAAALGKEQHRADELEDRLVARLEAAQTARAEIEQALHGAQDSLTEQTAALAEVRGQVKTAQAERDRLAAECATLRETLDKDLTEREALTADRAALTRDLDHAHARQQQVQQQLDEQTRVLGSRTGELNRSRERLAVAEAEAALLKRQIEGAAPKTGTR